MLKRVGIYVTQKMPFESYKAYVPMPLPPLNPTLDLNRLYPHLEQATLALAELNNLSQTILNAALFIYMYVRKEALLSSQIEGTQSSFNDLMLFEQAQKPNIAVADVEEVSHYVKAIYHGLNRLRNNFPLSLRLLREIHGVLLSGGKGVTKLPGEFRKTQNWLGGTRPGNAIFVPPPVDYLANCLNDFEKFLHDDSLPLLIKIGLAHVQFETIHPFLDGNGRLGRLLIILLLCDNNVLKEPILYLSLYLKQHRTLYYDLLQQVRLQGHWEAWLEFFLQGIIYSAKQAIQTAKNINQLFAQDLAKINRLKRARFSLLKVFDYLKQLPQTSPSSLSQALSISVPTARNALNTMVRLNILQETTGKQRDKVYCYQSYLSLLAEGTEPL